MLTLTLRLLERDGLVKRTPRETVPISVQYELTPLGLSFVDPVRSLTQWVKTYRVEVRTARQRYDEVKSAKTVCRQNDESHPDL